MKKAKKVTLLKTMDTGCVDAVITSETTTSEEIEKAISDMIEKRENGDGEYVWGWNDMVKCLPKDCEVIADFTNLGEAYY